MIVIMINPTLPQSAVAIFFYNHKEVFSAPENENLCENQVHNVLMGDGLSLFCSTNVMDDGEMKIIREQLSAKPW